MRRVLRSSSSTWVVASVAWTRTTRQAARLRSHSKKSFSEWRGNAYGTNLRQGSALSELENVLDSLRLDAYSLQECLELCFAKSYCTGVEFGRRQDRCKIWNQRLGR